MMELLIGVVPSFLDKNCLVSIESNWVAAGALEGGVYERRRREWYKYQN